MPAEYDYVEFDVSREDWTIFELRDGTILKAKFVLISVLKPKNRVGEYSTRSQTVVGAIVPEKYWGDPATKRYTQEELIAAIEEELDDDFRVKTPDQWNVYRLKDQVTISVKLELLNAARTKYCDEKGERIYVFNIQPIVKFKIPAELRKKLIEQRSTPTHT